MQLQQQQQQQLEASCWRGLRLTSLPLQLLQQLQEAPLQGSRGCCCRPKQQPFLWMSPGALQLLLLLLLLPLQCRGSSSRDLALCAALP